MTGDKDDPRFDKFYVKGNEIRLFIGLFLTDVPSYMALGFECRDTHLKPAPNEHYTKLYVFKIDQGPKATHGPYTWGENTALFKRLNLIRFFAEQNLDKIRTSNTQWLLFPDKTAQQKVIAWTQERSKFIFIANLDVNASITDVKIPISANANKQLKWVFTTRIAISSSNQGNQITVKEDHFTIPNLEAGEGHIYEIITSI